MSGPAPAPWPHPAALLSFVLGLASFALCLLGLTGLPALLIGYRGLRAVNASEGKYSGARLAVAGMVLGGLGTLATAAGLLGIFILRMQANAARTTCQDNLRQVGVSLNKYADAHETFPSAVVGPRGLPPERQLSWLSEVVPLMGQPPAGMKPTKRQEEVSKGYLDLYAKIDPRKAWDDEANAPVVESVVRAFRCPADPSFDPHRPPGETNYVGLSGIGPGAAALKREQPRAGMFGYDRGVKRDELAGGTSYTIAVLETALELGPWLAGGRPTVRELAPDAEHYCGAGRPFGGLHGGSMNVLYADGSVRPLGDSVDGAVVRKQATLLGPGR